MVKVKMNPVQQLAHDKVVIRFATLNNMIFSLLDK